MQSTGSTLGGIQNEANVQSCIEAQPFAASEMHEMPGLL